MRCSLLNVLLALCSTCLVHLPAYACPHSQPSSSQRVATLRIRSAANGIWFLYRQMGAPFSYNVVINITSIGRTVDPSDPFRSAQLQWWQWIQRLNSTTQCQQQFWTGTYSSSGRLVGEQGASDNNYIMRPTSYAVLYHTFSSLLLLYSCNQPLEDGMCANPVIYALTRIPPYKMLAEDQEGTDNGISSVFSKFCVGASDLYLQRYVGCDSCDCDFIEPPFCIRQYIDGMKRSVNTSTELFTTTATTTQRTTTRAMPATTTTGGRTPSYYVIPAARAIAPTQCKWPNFIPSQGQIDPSDSTGLLYVYRKLYADEYFLYSLIVFTHDLGPSPSTWNNSLTRAVWTFYAGYDTPTLDTCTYGYSVGSLEPSGLVTGAMLSYDSPNQPITFHPFNLMILHLDKLSTLYYGCVVPNFKTGICETPYILHGTRKNPLELDETETGFLVAVENMVFGPHRCGVSDIPEMKFIKDKTLCPLGPLVPPECIQDRIAGYNATLVSFIKSLFVWN